MQTQINDKVKKAAAEGRALEFCGIATLSCLDIRGVTSADSNRLFCVYNTSLPTNRGHADTLQVRLGKITGREARNKLLEKSRSDLKPETIDRAFGD